MNNNTDGAISAWTPKVFDDDADPARQMAQIREFCLTLQQNILENSFEIDRIRMDAGIDKRKTGPEDQRS